MSKGTPASPRAKASEPQPGDSGVFDFLAQRMPEPGQTAMARIRHIGPERQLQLAIQMTAALRSSAARVPLWSPQGLFKLKPYEQPPLLSREDLKQAPRRQRQLEQFDAVRTLIFRQGFDTLFRQFRLTNQSVFLRDVGVRDPETPQELMQSMVLLGVFPNTTRGLLVNADGPRPAYSWATAYAHRERGERAAVSFSVPANAEYVEKKIPWRGRAVAAWLLGQVRKRRLFERLGDNADPREVFELVQTLSSHMIDWEETILGRHYDAFTAWQEERHARDVETVKGRLGQLDEKFAVVKHHIWKQQIEPIKRHYPDAFTGNVEVSAPMGPEVHEAMRHEIADTAFRGRIVKGYRLSKALSSLFLALDAPLRAREAATWMTVAIAALGEADQGGLLPVRPLAESLRYGLRSGFTQFMYDALGAMANGWYPTWNSHAGVAVRNWRLLGDELGGNGFVNLDDAIPRGITRHLEDVARPADAQVMRDVGRRYQNLWGHVKARCQREIAAEERTLSKQTVKKNPGLTHLVGALTQAAVPSSAAH